MKSLVDKTNNPKIIEFLSHYIVSKKDILADDYEIDKIRKQYNNLIKKDRFLNLTLTYDFE